MQMLYHELLLEQLVKNVFLIKIKFYFFIDGKNEIILIDMQNVINESHLTGLLDLGVSACAQIHTCLETIVFSNVKEAYNVIS